MDAITLNTENTEDLKFEIKDEQSPHNPILCSQNKSIVHQDKHRQEFYKARAENFVKTENPTMTIKDKLNNIIDSLDGDIQIEEISIKHENCAESNEENAYIALKPQTASTCAKDAFNAGYFMPEKTECAEACASNTTMALEESFNGTEGSSTTLKIKEESFDDSEESFNGTKNSSTTLKIKEESFDDSEEEEESFNGTKNSSNTLRIKEESFDDSEEEFQYIQEPPAKKFAGRLQTEDEDKLQLLRYGHKPYMCTICGRAYPTSFELKMHLKEHSLDWSHKCKYCGRFYKYASSLRQHIKTQHMKVSMKFYRCDNCNETFETILALKSHSELDGLQKCNFTIETFTLLSEESTNTDRIDIKREPIYACQICQAFYTTKRRLEGHMVKHKDPNDAPFVCEQCNVGFSLRSKFILHKKNHYNYKCQVCNTFFQLKTQLEAHVAFYHGSKK